MRVMKALLAGKGWQEIMAEEGITKQAVYNISVLRKGRAWRTVRARLLGEVEGGKSGGAVL